MGNLFPPGNNMFKVNNRNTNTRCETCLKLIIKTPERRPGVFIVNFEHTSHLVLVFLLLTLSRLMSAGLYVTKGNPENLKCFQCVVYLMSEIKTNNVYDRATIELQQLKSF